MSNYSDVSFSSDANRDTASPSSTKSTEAVSDRKGDSATGQTGLCALYMDFLIDLCTHSKRNIWSSCDKDLHYRVLKLQKRAARIILYANRLGSSVTLFSKLGWIPFYEQIKINKCAVFYKRINGSSELSQ